jgi:hypothetical protein
MDFELRSPHRLLASSSQVRRSKAECGGLNFKNKTAAVLVFPPPLVPCCSKRPPVQLAPKINQHRLVESRLRQRQPPVNAEPYENGSAGFHDDHIAPDSLRVDRFRCSFGAPPNHVLQKISSSALQLVASPGKFVMAVHT